MNVKASQQRTLSASIQEKPRVRIALLASLLVISVLGLAWFDGGEEPLRPISQPVAVAGSDKPQD